MPISHDEAATFYHYILTENFLPYKAHWDANNHLLNSALMYPFYKVFGNDLIWLRMPNLLSFLLYALFGFKLLRGIQSRGLKTLAYLALITATLVVEFFGQMRGYGLSTGFLIAALYFISAFAKKPNWHNHIWIWIFTTLAILANLSLMLTALLMIGTVTLISFQKLIGRHRLTHLAIIALLGMTPIIFAAQYAFELKSRNLLYYGEGDSFMDITIHTLLRYTLGIESVVLDWLVVLIGAGASGWLLLKLLESRLQQWNMGAIAATLLFGNAIGALIMKALLDVNYPEDRVAIYFVPLFIITFVYFVNDLAQRKIGFPRASLKGVWAGALLLIFPVSFLAMANFKRVGVWYDLPISAEIYEYMDQVQAKGDKPVMISGNHLFALSWSYQRLKHKTKLPFLVPYRNDTHYLSEYALCYGARCDYYQPYYHEIFQDYTGLSVYKRNLDLVPQRIASASDSVDITGIGEYFNLFQTENDSILSQSLVAEISFQYSSELRPYDTNLVIASNDSGGTTNYYDFMPLKWMHQASDGDTYHIRRPIGLPANTDRMIIYLWNIQTANQRIGPFDVEIYAVKDELP